MASYKALNTTFKSREIKDLLSFLKRFTKKNCYLYKVKAFYNKANWHINLIINP